MNIGNKSVINTQGEEIDLVALLNQLLVNKWLILIVTLCTLSLGVFYVYRQVPNYQSQVLLQLDTNRPVWGQSSFADHLISGGGGSNTSIATQISLIKSPFILEPVVQALGLDITSSPLKTTLWEKLFPKNILKRKIQVKLFDVKRKDINKPFQLVIDKPNHVVLYNHQRQMVLQGFTKSLLINSDHTIKLRVDRIYAPVNARFSIMKHSRLSVVQSLIERLKLEEIGAKQYQSTGILSLTMCGPIPAEVIRMLNAIALKAKDQDAQKKSQEASQTLKFLYQQLPITRKQLENAEYKLNYYRARSGKIDIKLQTQFLLNQLSDLERKLGELRINKIDMVQRYTLHHPLFIALETQIKALESQKRTLELQLKKLPESDQIAVNLMRDVNVKKTLYLILLNKIQELQVVKAGTISGIRILSYAKTPDMPIPVHRSAIYLGCIMLGMMLSIMIIFSRRLLSQKIEDPHWGERQFNLPNLAIVPYCKEQILSQHNIDSSKILPLLAHTHPRNLSIESLRSLRTSLQVSLATAKNNIVSIMGASPGVGKSFVSANLAYLMASAGKRVALLDADLRKGTIHKYLNIPPSPGLSDLLNNKVAEEIMILPSRMHEKLFVLPRGAYPTDPAELLMSEKFKDLLSMLSKKFDVVIVDTAPILLVTDAVLVSTLSGSNYLVLGAGAHQPNEVEMALKRLGDAGVQLNGSIFNFQREQAKKTSYGQYYNNYSYYYYDDATGNKV